MPRSDESMGVLRQTFLVSPSRVGAVISPADSRSESSLAGSGWLSPQQVKDSCFPTVCVGGLFPSEVPQVDRVPWRSSLVRVILSLAAALFSSRVEIGVLSGSSVEYLELPRRVP